MAAWVIWLVIAVVLSVAETATLTAVLGLFGGAAFRSACVAAIGLPEDPGNDRGRSRMPRRPHTCDVFVFASVSSRNGCRHGGQNDHKDP